MLVRFGFLLKSKVKGQATPECYLSKLQNCNFWKIIGKMIFFLNMNNFYQIMKSWPYWSSEK
jgi:hypothetical protein